MVATYHDLYLNTRRALASLGIEASQLEAKEILCAASGKTVEELVRDMPLYASSTVAETAESMTKRRAAGEPIAYVLGEWSFLGLPFYVSPEVLIPRVDTEMLAQIAIRILRRTQENCRVLDLCAGSGCIGISVAAYQKNVRSVLVDWSDGALELCKRNIRRHRLTGRVVSVKGNAMEPPSPALGHFDLLLCNPPYIPSGDIPGLDSSVKDFEPVMALDGGADGLDFYRSVTEKWDAALRPGGLILFEVGIGQAEQVAWMLVKAGYENIRITRDTAGIDRVVEGQKHRDPEFEFFNLLPGETPKEGTAPAEPKETK